MNLTKNLRIRDPFVVVFDGAYYLYQSDGENHTVKVYKGNDLETWDDGRTVYRLSEESWGICDLWAPEVHFYQGNYYMFLSLLGKNGLRGTEISVSDTPDGMFVPLVNHPATPSDKSCIDGTLYVEDDVPYLVYSADWPHNYHKERDCYIGEIWAMPMSRDLRERAGEPFLLFRSDEAYCAKEPHVFQSHGKQTTRYGSDAPFLQRLSDGTLYLTWSPYPKDRYIVAAAVSENQSIRGIWNHLETPLFADNGGHAMFFTALDGKRKMCLHWPECPPNERALFLNVKEEHRRLVLENDGEMKSY